MWSAKTENRDATEKRGYVSATLGSTDTREGAEALMLEAAGSHAQTAGCTVEAVQTYPAKSFVYCSCGVFCGYVGQGR